MLGHLSALSEKKRTRPAAEHDCRKVSLETGWQSPPDAAQIHARAGKQHETEGSSSGDIDSSTIP